MENYKVKVNNEAESKEVQSLGERLGYKKPQPPSYISMKNGGYVCLGFNYDGVQEDLILLVAGFKEKDMNDIKDYKELTIQQLHDLVVLKRNDVGDATHTSDGRKYYLTASEFFEYIKGCWENVDEYVDGCIFEPISKMKEYLKIYNDGSCTLMYGAGYGGQDNWIEVPEKALMLIKHTNGREVWSYSDSKVNPLNTVLWQRHTQPINDESRKTYGLTKEKAERISENTKNAYLAKYPIDDNEVTSAEGYQQSEQLPFNTDVGDFESPRTAPEIADAALTHIRERASTYDQSGGERSAAKTAQAFNAITGHNINESEVWLLLQLLKDVRQWSREKYQQDSAEDCIAYAALKAESLERKQ